MANYIINECLTNDEYIVSAVTSLTVGEVIKFYIGEGNPFCGTVGEVTSSPVTPLSFYDSRYTDCCECLSGFTDSLNFKFLSSEGCLGMECRTLIILLLFINLSFSIKQTTKLMNCGSMVVTVVPPRNWFSF